MQEKRTGETIITSVSVTKYIKNLVDRYELSPTEVFRKGVGVSLCDLGELRYSTDLNKRRSEEVKAWLESFDEVCKFQERLEQVEKLLKEMQKN